MGGYLKPSDLEIHSVSIGLLSQALHIGYSEKTNEMDSCQTLQKVPDHCVLKTDSVCYQSLSGSVSGNSGCSWTVSPLVCHRKLLTSVLNTALTVILLQVQFNSVTLIFQLTQTIFWATFFLGFYLNIEINKGPLAADANLETLEYALIQIDDFGVTISKRSPHFLIFLMARCKFLCSPRLM